MTEGRFSDERLRDEVAQVAEVAGDGGECPAAERLVLSGRDELRPDENEEIIVHIARCTACAAAWRIARDIASEPAPVPFPASRTRSVVVRWAGLAAAAVVLLAAVSTGVFLLRPDRTTSPTLRTQEALLIESGVDEGTPLAREQCVLRWSAGPEGTHYDVRVMTAKLEPLVKREGIERPRLVVPEKALEGVSSGQRILWHVTARLPDGRRVESNTFFTEIE